MKLRNKQTGIIGELHYEPDKEYHFTVVTEDPADMAIYRTLAELYDKWEDYTPKEPLIKDEKIRKAVRAWAELLLTNEIHVARYDCMTVFRDEKTGYRLEIVTDDIQHGLYTIDELCGEEEE